MAQKVQVTYEDDLTGDTIAEGKGGPVTFGLDGVTYEIDLTDKNAAGLRKALAMYVEHGRKVTGKPSKRAASNGQGNSKAVREWAVAQGLDVPARGRIPAPVRDQYDAAH